jgi:hypothetical protein
MKNLLKTLMAVAAFGLAAGAAQAVEKDFNGNGYSSLFWENSNGGGCIWLMHTSDISNGVWNAGTDCAWVRNPTSGVVSAVDYGYPMPTIVPNGQFVNALPPNWHLVGISDFQNNNDTDMVWQDSVTGAAQIWYVHNGTILRTQLVRALTAMTSGAIVPLDQLNYNHNGQHLQIVAVSQNYIGYVDITYVASDGTIYVQYYSYDGGMAASTNGELNPIYTAPGADPNCPFAGGKLQPGWRIAGEFVNPPYPYYTPQADQNGVVFENTVDGSIVFAHLKTANDGVTSGPYQYSYYLTSPDAHVQAGWQIEGSGKFFGAGNYGDSACYTLGQDTDLVLGNPTTGQHVIWVFDAQGHGVAGYWLPTEAPAWHVANH